QLAPCLCRFRTFLENVRFVFRPRKLVVGLDQQPVVALFAGAARHANQMPAALQLLALKLELDMTLCKALLDVEVGFPLSAVPDNDRAAAILSLRDRAFEVAIVQRM